MRLTARRRPRIHCKLYESPFVGGASDSYATVIKSKSLLAIAFFFLSSVADRAWPIIDNEHWTISIRLLGECDNVIIFWSASQNQGALYSERDREHTRGASRNFPKGVAPPFQFPPFPSYRLFSSLPVPMPLSPTLSSHSRSGRNSTTKHILCTFSLKKHLF